MTSLRRPSSGRKTDDDAAAHPVQLKLRASSYTDASATQSAHLKRQVAGSSGLRRPMSCDSLQALDLEPDETSPKYNQPISNPFAQQAIGALTACFLAGGCVQDMAEDPELGMLLASGHADMVSLQACRLPTGVDLQQESAKLVAREAPEVFSRAHADKTRNGDIMVDDKHVRIVSVSTVVGADGMAAVSLNDGTRESPLIEFLTADNSPKADEASCLASSNLGEARNARSASSITSDLRTSEILGALEEDGLITRGRQAISRRTAQRTVPPSPR